MSLRQININISTLNLVLIIIGYPLVTTLLLPSSSDLSNISQSVTIPYRIFCLALMIVVTIINIRARVKVIIPFLALIMLWAFWIFRMFYDLYIKAIPVNDTAQLWLFVLGICIPALVSISKSIRVIDMNKALNWTWYSLSLILFVTLFSNQALINNTDNEYRVDGNIALNTISYGNVGVMTFVLTLFRLIKTNINSKWMYVLHILVCIISFYSILRAGSRGPVINLVVILLFWYFSGRKNILSGSLITVFFVTNLIVFKDFFLDLLGDIAPIIESRFRDTLEGNANDGRDALHSKAIEAFMESPFWGKQFGIFDGIGGYAYSHNIFLDGLMGLGIIGGGLIFYILTFGLRLIFYSIKNRINFFWISLILLQQIIASMFSGAFYQDQLLIALLAFIFLKRKNIILK